MPASRGNGSGVSSSRIVCRVNSHSDTGKINRRSARWTQPRRILANLSYVACSCGRELETEKTLELLLRHIVRAAEDVRFGHRPVAQLVHGDGGAEGDETHQTLFREERDELAEGILGVLKLLRGGGGVEHEQETRRRGFLLSIWYSTVVYPGKSSAGRLFSLISARGGGTGSDWSGDGGDSKIGVRARRRGTGSAADREPGGRRVRHRVTPGSAQRERGG